MIRNIVYMSIITSLIGASVVSIDLGFFQLSLFRALIISIASFIIIDLLLTNKKISIRSNKENYYSIIFMLVWFLYAFITLGWVKDYVSWIRAVYFLGLGFLCVIIFSKYLKNKFDILKAFQLITIMVIFHNLMGWYEVTTGNYLFLSDSISAYIRKSYPVSMFGNTNNFATFMLFSVFITYISAINAKSFSLKLIFFATIVSSVNLLIMTGSRANILGLILASAVFIYFSILNKRARNTLLLVLLSGFFIILLYPDMISNLFSMINEKLYFRFSEQVGSDAVRINLIKNGLTFLISTLGFGTGAGNIEYWMANYGVYDTGRIENMHNWWMEILTGYGLIIFVMYITFYIKLFLSAYKRFKLLDDKVNMSISLGIMCIMAGYIIGGISSSSNISCEWLWVFWAIAIAYQGICGSTNKNINLTKQ